MREIGTIPTGSKAWPGRGIFRVDDATYHGLPGLSQTRLKRCRTSLEAFRDSFSEPDEDTEAKQEGRATHCWFHEGPDAFARRFLLAPVCGGRKDVDKEAWIDACRAVADGPEWAGITCKSLKEDVEAAFAAAARRLGKDIVSEDWLHAMRAMIGNAERHPKIAAIMGGDGLNEIGVFDEWYVEGFERPILFRGKFDRVKVYPDQCIGMDTKTMPTFGDPEIESEDEDGNQVLRWPELRKYGRKYGLPIQCKAYERLWAGVAADYGLPPELKMTFAAMEKQPPHRALWFTPHSDTLASAAVRIDGWLRDICKARESGRWPGVPHDLQCVDMS